ncbi:MAG: sulfurtransferase complex subunit TusB [Pseudomonadales bacterium]|nr:sulfurtransferase complex subunit TusB [Pseudomonadales bacterium]
MILHTVNRSPFDTNCLNDCLEMAAAGSSIILIEDGVYAALSKTQFTDQMLAALPKHNFYVLRPDLQARGIQDCIIDEIEAVDYSGFVTLCTELDKVVSWY